MPPGDCQSLPPPHPRAVAVLNSARAPAIKKITGEDWARRPRPEGRRGTKHHKYPAIAEIRADTRTAQKVQ